MSVFVSILMGSANDKETMSGTKAVFDELGIRYEWRVLSAHRTPVETAEYVQDATARGAVVFIAAAGLAAHLAGAVAAQTLRPVIGVPVDAGPLKGMDALLATVQMPGGTPVSCMSIGRAGAVNAAHTAAQIMAIQDAGLYAKLQAMREAKRTAIAVADKALQAELV